MGKMGTVPQHCRSLYLTDNLVRLAQALDHLLALFPPPYGVITFLEEVVILGCAIHVFEKFALHLVFCESKENMISIKGKLSRLVARISSGHTARESA